MTGAYPKLTWFVGFAIQVPRVARSVVSFLLFALAATPTWAAANLSADASAFVVLQPAEIVSYEQWGQQFFLHYTVDLRGKGSKSGPYYSLSVQVQRMQSSADATKQCEGVFAVPTPKATRRRLPGYSCAFEQREDQVAWHYRSYWYAKCSYFVAVGEGAGYMALPGQAPVAPLLAALDSAAAKLDPSECDQPAFGDAQVRSALWTRLGQAEGPLARKCFDEAFAKLNEPRNAAIKERVEAAAYQQHLVEVMATAASADDFDPRWMDAAKSIGGSGDMKQRITDQLVRLLPGPFGTLVQLSQKAYRLSGGVNENVLLPKLKGKLYDAHKAERAGRPNDSPVEVLKDAGMHSGSWATAKTNLIRHFPGANDDAREQAMAEYLAARFDFIVRAREIAANKERHLAAAWAGAANDIARFRMSMLDCMAK